MSQANMTLTNVARTLFRSNLNAALAALSSCQSGTSRPTDIPAGGLWVNTTTATAWVLNLYDGADDIAIGTVNTTTNVFTPSIANNSLLPSKLALGAWTTVASAATVNLGAQTSRNIILSGTTGITSFGSTATPDNVPFNIRFSGSLTITHSANLILPGGADIVTEAGDIAVVVWDGSNVWRVVRYDRANGQALVSAIVNGLISTNFNNFTQPGFYRVAAVSTNAPFANANGNLLILGAVGDNTVTQVFYEVYTNPGSVWYRFRDSTSTWSAWFSLTPVGGGGQAWQNVIGSRAIATTYTNTTAKPIMVSVLCGGNATTWYLLQTLRYKTYSRPRKDANKESISTSLGGLCWR